MTVLIHDGKRYDFGDTLQSPPIGAVDELNRALSVTPKTIRTFFSSIASRRDEPDFDGEALMYSHEYITNFMGLLFLAKRRAGEPFTLEQAKTVAYADVVMEDEGDEVEDADPKAPSVPDDDLAAAMETQQTL